MSDLISRCELFNRLASVEKSADVVSIINEMPTIEPMRWIPVTERLPEQTGKYMVTVSNGNVYAGTYSSYEGKFSCAAVAWMPLPEPYGGDADGDT